MEDFGCERKSTYENFNWNPKSSNTIIDRYTIIIITCREVEKKVETKELADNIGSLSYMYIT